jgi:hypothetical protein
VKAFSILFYFFAYHNIWAIFLLLFIGIAIDVWRRKPLYTIVLLVLGFVNIFTGHVINSIFLAKFGQHGRAIITSSVRTNSTLNYQYVWDYTAIIRTKEGKEARTKFSTTTASFYPITNSINIPPENEWFIVNYVPGFEKNIVIMTDESAYGQRILVYKNLESVTRAKNQFNASPNNPSFKKEYLQELQLFIANPINASDTSNISEFKKIIQSLKK